MSTSATTSIALRWSPALLALALLVVVSAGCACQTASQTTYTIDEDPLPTLCAVCNHPTVPLESVKDDRSQPSLNLSVWNRSICGNPFINRSTPWCPNCHFAYLPMLKRWQRSSEDPTSLCRPFSPGIAEFPKPKTIKSRVVYEQSYSAGLWTESISFWFQDEAEYVDSVTQFAGSHGLSVSCEQRESVPEEQFLHAVRSVR